MPEDFLKFDHCYMNLPVDAVEFLDAFIGLFNHANPKVWGDHLPMIHVYGFSFHHEDDKAREYFVERIGKAMHFPGFKSEHIAHFHNIRTVSPQSIMYGVSFRLPKEVAFSMEDTTKLERVEGIYDELEDKSRQKMPKFE